MAATKQIVEVKWKDHVFSNGKYEKSDKALIAQRSVGYIVKQNKKVLILAQSLQGSQLEPHEILTIDMRSNPKVRRLS